VKLYLKIFLSLFLLQSMHQSVLTIDQDNKKNNIDMLLESMYKDYFITKEMIRAYIVKTFFIDEKKLSKSSIACISCNSVRVGQSLWAYLIMHFEEKLLNQFMQVAYKGSTNELSNFLLQTYQQLEIECSRCCAYHGYYIVELDVR